MLSRIIPFFVTEDDVAVLAHQFHDQTLSAGIPQLIKMLSSNFHHTLHSRLFHIKDTGASDVLSEEACRSSVQLKD